MKPYDATLDSEQLRQAMRAWTSGVTIVTATHAGERHGMTVSSFTSIALDPPVIIVSLQTDSRTHNLIAQSNAFGVTILAQGQEKLSDLFAGRTPDIVDRLAGIETEALVTGAPFIKGGLAYLDCRVTQAIPVGRNTLFLAEVIAARGDGAGRALVYHNQKYRKLID
jgi:flavin reductase (DIM6/NTAB) family NADH-FMN oxidoreductase RutF